MNDIERKKAQFNDRCLSQSKSNASYKKFVKKILWGYKIEEFNP